MRQIRSQSAEAQMQNNNKTPKDKNEKQRKWLTNVLKKLTQRKTLFPVLFFCLYILRKRNPKLSAWALSFLQPIRRVEFSTFLSDLHNRHIHRVLLANSFFEVTLKNREVYRTLQLPSSLNVSGMYLLELFQDYQVQFATKKESFWRTKLINFTLAMIPFVYLGLTYRMLQRMFGEKDTSATVGKEPSTDPLSAQNNTPTFQDVAGIDYAKRELEEIVDFLKSPAKYQAMGARMPKGVLLCGPSGTGKTLLARALANEAGVSFLCCSASEFVETLVGRGAARVRELFARALKSSPCIIFIDELDALAKKRGGINSNDEREQTLNQLLTEMDGFHTSSSNPQIVVLAATNRPQVLDPALVRAGRFDRHVYVKNPTEKGRQAILKVHTRSIPLAASVSIGALAKKAVDQSGAQLANWVNEAALLAVRERSSVVTMGHFYQIWQKQQQHQKDLKQNSSSASADTSTSQFVKLFSSLPHQPQQ